MAELADVVGDEEGAPCNRMVGGDVCDGVMVVEPDGDCYCHTRPPCGTCLDALTCSACAYRLSDDGMCP